ncbi:LamG-like jellyroll fold domain-containing protein [Flavobacterium sp.]|jgi:hypothetical protein|uniref:Ig-like domain-containing protein n=1 Tax=Flavobacterium sp. TaxID=239 RepID=UPI0037BF81B8
MKSIYRYLLLFTITLFNVTTSNSQCTGCQYTITVPNNGIHNLTSGQVVCIIGNGTFSGRLDNFNGNTLCIGTGVIYNPSSTPNYNGNWTIRNHGTFQNTGNLNFNSGTSFYNGPTGTISLGSINVNSGVSFTNEGNLTLTGLNVNSGANVTLGGTTQINGNISNNGNITVVGSITANNITNNSSGRITGGTGTNCNSIRANGSFTNNGIYGQTGSGLFVGNTGGTILSPATTAVPVAPGSQPSNLNLTVSGNNINGSFTQTSTSSNGYFILRAITTGAAPAITNPSNFASLTVGSTLGAWTVVAINNSQGTTTFSDNVGTTCDMIHYRIYSFNAAGSTNCRVYNTTNVLTGSISKNPTITNTTPGSRCGAGTVLLTATSSSGTLNWYASSTSSTVLGTGSSFTTPSINSTTTYFVSAVNGSCSSARVSVNAVVNQIPTFTSIVSGSRVGNGSVNLAATTSLGTINWYANETDTVPFHTGSTYTTPILNASTIYYVQINNAGCLSEKMPIIATILEDTDGDGVENETDLDSDNDGILDSIECKPCLSNPFENGNFESPVIANASYSIMPTNNVPGWQTSAENFIEIWSSGFNGVPAASGNQFAELNANVPGILYQSFCLNGAGGTINWSIKHRGRSGVDQAFVKFGSTLANALASTPIATMVDGNTAWGTYSGVYVIPEGQTQIVLTFQAGYTASGSQSVGNFIDDVQITINQECVDTDNDGIANYLDLDSDNDGIPDIEEAGFKNKSNQTATFDKTDASLWMDANNNGLNDFAENLIAANNYIIPDTDGDSVPDYLDLDSDNDSLFDVDEAGLLNGDGDINGDGKGDGADTDGDGILNLYDNSTNFGTVGRAYAQDTDSNGVSDYLQLDSNGDGVFDIQTSLYAHLDSNNDGKMEGSDDIDQDGIVDTFDTNTSKTGSPRDINQKLFLDFDGRNDYAQGSSVLGGLSQVSVMAWINLTAPYNSNGIIVGQNRFYIRVNASRRLQVVFNGTAFSYNTSLSASRWYHVGATLGDGFLRIYVNGSNVVSYPTTDAINSDNTLLTLGKNPNANNSFFKGKIDEVRIFNTTLTAQQVQRMVYQEIENNNGQVRGVIVPRDIEDLPFANLIRYYRMDVYKDDIIDDLTTPGIDTNTGMKIFNHKNIIGQQAPMPFVTSQSGNFATAVNNTQNEVRGLDVIDYNHAIIRVNHDITQTANISTMGLLIEPNVTIKMSNDTKLQNDWYLKLDGKIDLESRSQLIQTERSELDPTSSGRIERDQQGQSNKFNYNYWSSPVSSINNSTINLGYTVAGVMKDGTNPDNPVNIAWVSGTNNPLTSNPITLSSYWIYKFQNVSPIYANWATVGQNGALLAGQGYTLKGSGAASPNQNFTFIGKPNNGEITSFVSANNLNLSGNPYPSALDANEFISQNLSAINGTLYFWEHFSTNNTHNLAGYQGGYATRNLVGGTAPVSPTGVSGLGSRTRTPGRFIPVGQGFFVRGNTTGGSFTFNNSQRLFIKENNTDSNVLFRSANQNEVTSEEEVQYGTDNNQEDTYTEDEFMKIRIGFNSYNNYHRQLLIGFMNELATEEIDLGYDAVHIDNQQNDMYFLHNGVKLIIQGASYFDVNKVYPLGIKTFAAGNVEFTLDGTENVPEDTDIFIHDKTTGLYHSIKNEHFNIELPQGETHNRFELTFSNGTLSTGDYNLDNEIAVAFTNAQNLLTIKNNLTDVTVETVSIFTILGQTLATWNVENETQTNISLPVSNVSTGTYIVRVQTTAGTISKKIIIK